MKRTLSLLLSLLLAAALTGCRAGTPAPEPSAPAGDPAPVEQPVPAPAETPAETPAEPLPVAYTIEHTDLSEGLPIDMYFEIPVFTGGGEAIARINADLAALRDGYVENEAPNVLDLVRADLADGGTADGARYLNAHSASVPTCTDALISVIISYEWWLGGVTDYGAQTRTYDAVTGDVLTLPDLVEGTDEEILETVVAALLEQYPGVEEQGVMESPMDTIRAMDPRSIEFYVQDGAVHVCFAKYEIAYGAAGAFDVTLPGAIRARS